jgi:glutathione S-transferase
MLQLILHHYPRSPFAEKARCLLGFKQLAWSSVIIPPIMPKPDVIALTGGYRRTPILQIGADIFCDTALIAEVLENIAPTPTLYPSAIASSARIQAQWADSSLFWCAVPYTLQPAGLQHMFAGAPPEMIQAFGNDRAALRGNAPRIGLAEATSTLHAYIHLIDQQLADGRPWLLGAQISIADFSTYHPLWFVRQAGAIGGIVDAHPQVAAWMQRLHAIGHGSFEKMDSSAAIAIASATTPQKVANPELFELPGFQVGDVVTIAASDYGTDPIDGELVAVYRHEFLLRRFDPRAGEVTVHFPRLGYQIKHKKQEAST